MAVKRLITPFEHIKKHTFSEKEAITQTINNGLVCFVNIGRSRK
jgi:hypothetical protein